MESQRRFTEALRRWLTLSCRLGGATKPNRQQTQRFFITVDNLGAADWQLDTDQQFHTATWGFRRERQPNGSGEESQGLLIQNPRLIILAQSPLFMVERSTGLNLGAYDPDFYRRVKSDVVLKTKYLVYFVDAFNQARHSVPMQLTMKGAPGVSFGDHLLKFRLELELAFAFAHNQPVKRKSARFHAMGVFCIQTEPQQRGEEHLCLGLYYCEP